MMWFLLLFMNCSSCESNESHQDERFENLDQGQQHPPIPANNPAWEWDAGGFVPDFGWYGEHSWADVHMRVAGHISAIGRDIARLHVKNGNLSQAAESYASLAKLLRDIQSKSRSSTYAVAILKTLIAGAERDAKWLTALSQNIAPDTSTGPISKIRLHYYQLALKHQQGESVTEALKELQQSILNEIKERPELKIDEFSDFNDRHALRGRLFEAYVDSLDPMSLSERWGYWRASEINRQLYAIGWAAGLLGGEDWNQQLVDAYGVSPEFDMKPKAIFLPSMALETLQDKDQALSSDANEFGRLPTGDSLIDVGGTPGPMAIGTLMKWGLEDDEHKLWLERQATKLISNLDDADKYSSQAIDKLKAGKHGSKYYNIKQFRNATVRQLARSRRYQSAHAIWMDQLPFKHQDWACPNREGIVLSIAGRLLALAKDPSAMETLSKAMTASKVFYQQSLDAEAGKINGPRPPAFGAGQGVHKGSNPHKNHQASPNGGQRGEQGAPPPPRR